MAACVLACWCSASEASAQPQTGPPCDRAFRVRVAEDRLRGPDELEARVNARADLNRDGAEDLVVVRTYDGVASCGNYGECEFGALLSCGGGRYAWLIEPDYRTDLTVAATETMVGPTAWRDLHEVQRQGGAASLEADRMDAGLDLFLTVVWRAGPNGYRRPRYGVAGVSDECARARQERRGDAPAWCARALRNARLADGETPARPEDRRRMRRLRASVLYELGRLAEQNADLAAARRHYRASLRLRRSRPVQARLDGLADAE